ncbi:hypothetical protein [uncultured Pseudokineococcus sp.]|uniref:hypothetical protein n=1 Tax=uncultured Pseudokineococcus sp. TaxID=1642928 RepID=UPI002614F512|nr:hypothetical protein [uncultured Pseudokineococcus sp.]
MRLTVHPRALLWLLLPIAVLLVLASFSATLVGLASAGTDPFVGYERLMAALAVDAETTIPAWFSVSLLLLCALLLVDVARTTRLEGSRWRWHWAALAVVFAYMSMDEGSRLHETGSSVLEAAGIDTGLRFGWVALAIPVMLVFLVLMIPFLLALPRRTALRFVLAGTVFVGGAVGMEFAGGWAWDTAGEQSALYAGISSVEELLEMVGAILFAWAVADHQRRHLAAAAAVDGRAAAGSAPQGASAAPVRAA